MFKNVKIFVCAKPLRMCGARGQIILGCKDLAPAYPIDLNPYWKVLLYVMKISPLRA